MFAFAAAGGEGGIDFPFFDDADLTRAITSLPTPLINAASSDVIRRGQTKNG